MKKILFFILVIYIFAGCKNFNGMSEITNTSDVIEELTEKIEELNILNSELIEEITNFKRIPLRFENIVVENPVMYQTTYEIDERLIGRYAIEDDPKTYFEIKPNGEAEISLAVFREFLPNTDEYQVTSSENLLITAFYSDLSNAICFLLINNDRSFPGSYFAIDFSGDYDCTYFISKTYHSAERLKFIKVN